MLRLLAEYAHKHELVTEPGFAPKSARWAIVCAADGHFLELVEIGDVEAKKNPGREFAKAPDFSFTDMKARGITKSHFLIDTTEVVALLGKNAGEAKTVAKHKYFIKLQTPAPPCRSWRSLLSASQMRARSKRYENAVRRRRRSRMRRSRCALDRPFRWNRTRGTTGGAGSGQLWTWANRPRRKCAPS